MAFDDTFERSDGIKLYAKFPNWAVLIEVDSREKLYFVVGSIGIVVDEVLGLRKGKNPSLCNEQFVVYREKDIMDDEQDKLYQPPLYHHKVCTATNLVSISAA